MLLSEIAYKYKCDSKTKHYFKIGICEYLGIAPLHPLKTFLFVPQKVLNLNWK